MLIGNQKRKYTRSFITSGKQYNLEYSILQGKDLHSRFPYFRFLSNEEGIYSATRSGYVSPRNVVKMEKLLAIRKGCTVIDDVVNSIKDGNGGHVIQTDDGRIFRSRKVLVTTGAFTHCRDLLPKGFKPKMQIIPNCVIKVRGYIPSIAWGTLHINRCQC